jgi:hypothetical protein
MTSFNTRPCGQPELLGGMSGIDEADLPAQAVSDRPPEGEFRYIIDLVTEGAG